MEKSKLIKEFALLFDMNEKKINSKIKLESLRNWDSLKQMELMAFLEKILKRRIKLSEILKLKSFLDIEKILKIKK